MQPEARIVDKIKKFIDTIPESCCEKRHGSPYGKTGQPDITGCIKGRRFEIEVKVPDENAAPERVVCPYWPDEARAMADGSLSAPGNKPTALQARRLEEWQAAGAVAFVAYSVEAVKCAFIMRGYGA